MLLWVSCGKDLNIRPTGLQQFKNYSFEMSYTNKLSNLPLTLKCKGKQTYLFDLSLFLLQVTVCNLCKGFDPQHIHKSLRFWKTSSKV